MNTLQLYLTAHKWPELAAMNQLTEAGVISDNAILAADVWESDATKAVQWLEAEHRNKLMQM